MCVCGFFSTFFFKQSRTQVIVTLVSERGALEGSLFRETRGLSEPSRNGINETCALQVRSGTAGAGGGGRTGPACARQAARGSAVPEVTALPQPSRAPCTPQAPRAVGVSPAASASPIGCACACTSERARARACGHAHRIGAATMRGGARGTNALIWVFPHKYCLFEHSVKTQELDGFPNSGATRTRKGKVQRAGRSPAGAGGWTSPGPEPGLLSPSRCFLLSPPPPPPSPENPAHGGLAHLTKMEGDKKRN